MEKNQFCQKLCVWLQAFHYFCRSLWRSLIVFHIKYYWNLFLISLMSTISACVWLYCVYTTSVMVQKKAKHIREEILFYLCTFNGRMNYLCTLLTTSRGCAKKSLPSLNVELFSSRFYLIEAKNVPAGKMKDFNWKSRVFFFSHDNDGKKGG